MSTPRLPATTVDYSAALHQSTPAARTDTLIAAIKLCGDVYCLELAGDEDRFAICEAASAAPHTEKYLLMR